MPSAPAASIARTRSEFFLSFDLRAIELRVELKFPASTTQCAEPFAKRALAIDAHKIRVDEDVTDVLLFNRPLKNALKLRMNGGLAARELQNVDEAFASKHA